MSPPPVSEGSPSQVAEGSSAAQARLPHASDEVCAEWERLLHVADEESRLLGQHRGAGMGHH